MNTLHIFGKLERKKIVARYKVGAKMELIFDITLLESDANYA
jgi:hypothetical protein